jgi:hypothetical protein
VSASRVLGPARDHACVRCGRRAASWHHRLARGRGGPDDAYNCIPLCGSGTTGCHGWVEHNRAAAREAFLLIAGYFLRGRYVGPDDVYRWHYNGEIWDLVARVWRSPVPGEVEPDCAFAETDR